MMSVIGQCTFPDYEDYGLRCEEARFLCGHELDGYMGRLLVEKSPLPQPFPLCAGAGQADNIQWFSFIADDSVLELTISYSNCTNNQLAPGLQVGIFSSCDMDSGHVPLGSIFCIEGTGYTDISVTPDAMDIEPGQLYLLFIDGYAGSTCDFEIEVVSGVCTDLPDTTQECEIDCGVVANYQGDFGCTMFPDTFSFLPSSQIIDDVFGCNPIVNNIELDSIICVEWDIQPNVGFNYISSSFEYFDSIGVVPTLIVEWTVPGTYTIEPIITFNPLYSNCSGICGCTDDVVFTIEVNESTVSQLPDLEICPGECVDFCNTTYCDTGMYECRDRDQCLIEIQAVVERANVEMDEGVFFICPGECVEFQNLMYCDPDNYAVADSAACDTTYLFQVEEINLSVNLIQSDDLINCTILEANLEGGWNTNFTGTIHSAWISESGDTLVKDAEYTTQEDGVYTFMAWPEGMKSCANAITHTVIKDDAVPSANLFSPFLDCNNPSEAITLNSPDDILMVNWSGPNGFTSNDENPMVNEAGIYMVTITATNGCDITLQTEVAADFIEPDVEVDFEDLTCSEEIPTASYTANKDVLSHSWILPDASTSSIDVLNLNTPGNYSLEVTGVNGCTATQFFDVADLWYDPSLFLNEDKIWRCLDTMIDLDLSAQEKPGMRYTWTSLEGTVLSNSINLIITRPGTYILTTVDESVECIGKDTVRVIDDPNPFLDIEYSISAPLCEGGEDGIVEIVNIDGGTGPYTFEVDGEVLSDPTDMNFAAGSYQIDVFDLFGCRVTKQVDVPETKAFTLDAEPELEIRFGQTKTLTFLTSLDNDDIGFIEWYNPEGEILGLDRELEYTADVSDVIYLRVENLDGCEVIAEVRVNVNFDVDIYYPNVFSPNNDGSNDFFILYNNGYPETADDLKIFDRSGELIYKSSTTEFNETKEGWDGTFNGQDCQPGVYVFVLQYTLMNGRKKTLSGSITLVR